MHSFCANAMWYAESSCNGYSLRLGMFSVSESLNRLNSLMAGWLSLMSLAFSENSRNSRSLSLKSWRSFPTCPS